MKRKVKNAQGEWSDKEQEVEEKFLDPLWQKVVAAAVIAKGTQEATKRGWLGGVRQGIDISDVDLDIDW